MNFLEKQIDFYDRKFLELPNKPILFSLLEGNAPGEIFIDHEENPRCVLIRSQFFSTLHHVFLAGDPSLDHLIKINEMLKEIYPISFACPPQYHGFFIEKKFRIQPRIELVYPFSSGEGAPKKPAGVRVLSLEEDIFDRCHMKKEIMKTYGSKESFLEKGRGFLLEKEGEIVSETYGIFVGGGACEMCLVTHPSYQKQGFGTFLASCLVEDCLQRGLQPFWSCNSENIGSLKVALKLGFVIKQHYAFLRK